MEFDQVLKKVGSFGTHQKRLVLLLSLVGIPAAFHNLGYVFWGARPDHWCGLPDNPVFHDNFTASERRQLVAPLKKGYDGIFRHDPCSMYDRDYRNMTYDDVRQALSALADNRSTGAAKKHLPCEYWEYDDTQYQSTIVSEWDLVCERSILTSTTQSLYMAGRLVATVAFGHLADRMGRRVALIISTLITVSMSLCSALMPNYYAFLITRCLVAFGATGEFQTSFVILVEVVGSRWRSVTGTMMMMMWAVGYITLAAIAYCFRERMSFMLVTSAPLVLTVAYYWLIPESPRWQISKGRVEPAMKTLNKMAATNGRSLPAGLEVHVPASQQSQGTVLDLLRSSHMRRTTLLLFYIWFVNSLVYFGLSLNSSTLGGNDYVNFFIGGIVEIPAYLLAFVMLWKCERRIPLSGLMITAGVALLATIPFLHGDTSTIVVVLAMVGKFAITCSYSMIYVYATEVFPTVVRTLGLGMCSFMSRIGGIIAPYAAEMDALYHGMPLIVFGAFSLIGGLVVFLLPETAGQPLPQTFEEAERLSSNSNCRICMCKNVEKENTEEDLDEDYNQVKKEHLPLNGICDNKEVFIIQEKDSESTVKRDNPVI